MKQCLGCSGLVPEGASGCPNCAVSRGGVVRKLVVAVGSFAVASGCLAVPVYGAPCTQKQVDGGSNGCGDCDTLLVDGGDPAKDTSSYCFVDGGTP